MVLFCVYLCIYVAIEVIFSMEIRSGNSLQLIHGFVIRIHPVTESTKLKAAVQSNVTAAGANVDFVLTRLNRPLLSDDIPNAKIALG